MDAILAPGQLTRAEWAARITALWQQSLTGIIETGRSLIEAQDNLDHGEWLLMVKNDLPFGAKTAQRLMKISTDPRLAAHAPHLPPSWYSMYEHAGLMGGEIIIEEDDDDPKPKPLSLPPTRH